MLAFHCLNNFMSEMFDKLRIAGSYIKIFSTFTVSEIHYLIYGNNKKNFA